MLWVGEFVRIGVDAVLMRRIFVSGTQIPIPSLV
jgi:hypothetical protein